MQDAAKEGVIEYVFSEGVSGTDYPRAMREYAEQDNKLIIGEAYAVEKEARSVAADYPDTAFVLGSSGEAADSNFGIFGTWNYDGAYLAGMLAGKMTKSNVVGSVGAIPIPEVNMLINAFGAGVKAVNPGAKHLVSFIGTFFDPPKAREAGLAQIDAGADVLFGERIGTADAAKERGIKSVGSLIDYTPRYPDTVFANAIWNFRRSSPRSSPTCRTGSASSSGRGSTDSRTRSAPNARHSSPSSSSPGRTRRSTGSSTRPNSSRRRVTARITTASRRASPHGSTLRLDAARSATARPRSARGRSWG